MAGKSHSPDPTIVDSEGPGPANTDDGKGYANHDGQMTANLDGKGWTGAVEPPVGE